MEVLEQSFTHIFHSLRSLLSDTTKSALPLDKKFDNSSTEVPRNTEQLLEKSWWDIAGRLPENLMKHADYSCENDMLEFIKKDVVPFLGSSRIDSAEPSRHSFMTDDGGPVELGWDWGTMPDSKPHIRFAFEPMDSATRSGSDFDIQSIPGVDIEWFQHFSQIFVINAPTSPDPSDHTSQVFYGFDKRKDSIMTKAYFFPEIKARMSGQSTWEVLLKAINSAAHYSASNTKALDILSNFLNQEVSALRIEMLAIDLLKPEASRIKIYFRSQATDFTSVVRIMSLNGLLNTPNFHTGINQLRDLWTELFDLENGESLPHVEHRTAGILYYANFRLGDKVPGVKIYIPVRHYARSDRKVLDVLGKFLKNRGQGQFFEDYERAMYDTL